MPPKKSRNRSRASSAKTNKTDLQTEIDYNLELTKYRNQIELLQQQVEKLKNETALLKNEIIILRQHKNNKLNDAISEDIEKVDVIHHNRGELELGNQGGVKIKGCTCKGNCSSKICGCVKKNKSCQEFCRCNESLCKNQDLGKENDELAILSKNGQHIIEKLGGLTLNQEKLHASEKKAKRSIFSPFNGNKGMINRDIASPASPLTFVTRRRLFTQNSDELIDIKTDSEVEKNSAVEKHENSEACTDDLITNNYETVVKKAEVEAITGDCSTKQKCHRTRQIKQKVSHSPQVFKEANKLDYSDHNEQKNENNKACLKIKINLVSDNDLLELHRVDHLPKQLQNKNVKFLEKNPKVDGVKTMRVQHSPQSSSSKTWYQSETNTENLVHEILQDASFNPMIPKRQLARSPVFSEMMQAKLQDTKNFSPTKKELAVEEVDWEQHQAELVLCKICKRKFFPHRIEKHSKSCKGI